MKAGAICLRRGPNGIEVLLIRSSGGRHLFPKGHIEPGEAVWDAADRELFEEAGYRARVFRLSLPPYRERSGEVVQPVLCLNLQRLDEPEAGREPGWHSLVETARRVFMENERPIADSMMAALDAALELFLQDEQTAGRAG